MINDWWANDDFEKFWVESTDRIDIGANLKAPNFNEHNQDFWGYSLFRHAKIGDIVFHYKKPDGFVGFSQISGPAEDHEVLWSARSKSATEKGIKPYPRPGYKIPIINFVKFEPIISLEMIRVHELEIRKQISALKEQVSGPLYFGFELSETRSIKPLQGAYASKLPSAIVDIFSQMQSASRRLITNNIDTVQSDLNIKSGKEGAVKQGFHKYRERDRGLAKDKKKNALNELGKLECEVCCFDFYKEYGEIGKTFIECHHIIPLHAVKNETETTLEDLALVCSNCHRMIHSKKEWLSLNELREKRAQAKTRKCN